MRDPLNVRSELEAEPTVKILEVDSAIMLHDLANLIMAMAASIDQAARALPSPGDLDRVDLGERLDITASLLASAWRSGRVVGRMIEHLRAGMSLPDVRNRSQVDLTALAGEAVDAMRGLAGDRVTLVVVGADDRLFAWGDKDALARALLNVLINAVESMPGPRVGRVELRLFREPTWAVLEVADDGPGMDADELQRVRGRGVSGKGSTGLGLTSCVEAMEAAGGTMQITSVRGVGTMVSLRLPSVPRAGGLEVVETVEE